MYMKNPPAAFDVAEGGGEGILPGGLNPYLIVIPRLMRFLQGGGGGSREGVGVAAN